MIPDEKKTLMRQVINVFEQGKVSTRYDVIYIYNDGPNRKRQITLSFGITEYGNLKKLIQKYILVNGEYSTNFRKYSDKIGRQALVDDKEFKTLLIQAARNDEAFRDCMEEIYDEMYWNPAHQWFLNNGFTKNLSMMVILDSFIHSGSILGFLRNRFKENVPSTGGNEEMWINQYLDVRRKWLAAHTNPILRGTVYRIDFLKSEAKKANWSFNCPFVKANGVTIC
jgi:chitosanase